MDPGLRACGLAFWRTEIADGPLVDRRRTSTLRHACLVKNPGDEWQRMLEAVEDTMDDQCVGGFIVAELPQVYERIKSKGDPNDLVRLAVFIGALVGRRPHKLYLPSEWKKQVPKSVTEHRARKRLSEEELSKIVVPSARSLEHNVWDSIGIGLFHLGR